MPTTHRIIHDFLYEKLKEYTEGNILDMMEKPDENKKIITIPKIKDLIIELTELLEN